MPRTRTVIHGEGDCSKGKNNSGQTLSSSTRCRISATTPTTVTLEPILVLFPRAAASIRTLSESIDQLTFRRTLWSPPSLFYLVSHCGNGCAPAQDFEVSFGFADIAIRLLR